jgi:hypothetical protein
MDFATAQNRSLAGDYSGYTSETGQGYSINDTSPPGHPTWVFPGYGVNQARNNGADLEPIPITPIKHQNWPEMQIQLMNGWELTNYGEKLSYDDYLRMLTTQENGARSFISPGPKGTTAGNQPIGPSPLNVQAWAQSGPGAQPNNPGGPGQLIAALGARNYYG